MHDLVVQQFINKDRAPPSVFALHEALKRGELPPELASVAAAYEAVAGSDIAITDCTPCPVMLENVQVGVYPGKKSAARNTAWAMAALDETPMHCVNWPSFSNIEECRLVLTLRNIRDVSVHVIGKMYVVCEGGCCSF